MTKRLKYKEFKQLKFILIDMNNTVINLTSYINSFVEIDTFNYEAIKLTTSLCEKEIDNEIITATNLIDTAEHIIANIYNYDYQWLKNQFTNINNSLQELKLYPKQNNHI